MSMIVKKEHSVVYSTFNGINGSRPELTRAGAITALILPIILFPVAQRSFVQVSWSQV